VLTRLTSNRYSLRSVSGPVSVHTVRTSSRVSCASLGTVNCAEIAATGSLSLPLLALYTFTTDSPATPATPGSLLSSIRLNLTSDTQPARTTRCTGPKSARPSYGLTVTNLCEPTDGAATEENQDNQHLSRATSGHGFIHRVPRNGAPECTVVTGRPQLSFAAATTLNRSPGGAVLNWSRWGPLRSSPRRSISLASPAPAGVFAPPLHFMIGCCGSCRR
jgi:hypothetical protein